MDCFSQPRDLIVITKVCTKCKEEKPFGDFYKRKARKKGRVSRCKECVKNHRRKQNTWPESKFHRRNRHLEYTYGITLEDWERMFADQHGCCGLCGKHQSELEMSLAVDHRHSDGKVRGLLCNQCNLKLGQYESSKKWYKENKVSVDKYLE